MKNEQIICDYCKKQVPEKKDEMPTWFGRYKIDKLIGIICKDCFPEHKDKYIKGEK